MSGEKFAKNFLKLNLSIIKDDKEKIKNELYSLSRSEQENFILQLATKFILYHLDGKLIDKIKEKINLGLIISSELNINLQKLLDRNWIWNNSKKLRKSLGEGEFGIHPEDYPTSYDIIEAHEIFLDTYPIIENKSKEEEKYSNKAELHRELQEQIEKYGTVQTRDPNCKIILTNIKGKKEKYCISPSDIDEKSFIKKLGISLHHRGETLLRGSGNIFALIPHQDYYTLKPLKSIPKDWEDLFMSNNPKFVGSGAYGEVSIVPENVVRKTGLHTKFPQDMVMEIGMYNFLDKLKCLPKLYGFNMDNNSFYLEKGIKNLHERIKEPLSYSEKLEIMFRLCKCMRSIAGQGVIHLDLKPQNIILSEDEKIQIIDWGLAEIDTRRYDFRTKNINKQTLWYKSPELLADFPKYGVAVDIYSLGLIFLELFIGRPPLPGYDDYEQCIHELRLSGFTEYVVKYDDHKNIYYFDSFDNEILDMKKKFREVYNMVNYSTKHMIVSRLEEKFNIQDEVLQDFLSGMLEFKPEFRSKWNDIILHPIFQRMKRESIPRFNMLINNMPIISNINNIWNTKTPKRILSQGIRHSAFYWLDKFTEKFRICREGLELAFQLLDLVVYYAKMEINMNNIGNIKGACLSIALNIYWSDYSTEAVDRIIIKSSREDINLDHMKLFRNDILIMFGGNIIIPTFTSYNYFLEKPLVDSFENYLRDDIYTTSFLYQLSGEKTKVDMWKI